MRSSQRNSKPAMTLQKWVESAAPIVHELLEIEHDAAGVAYQWAYVPHDVRGGEGPDEPLEGAQAKIDRRFERIVGAPVQNGYVDAATARNVLDLIRLLGEVSGVKDRDMTAPLPKAYKAWTDREEFYEEVSPAQYTVDGLRFGGKLRFSPGRKLRLAADAALLR